MGSGSRLRKHAVGLADLAARFQYQRR
jgi:hypothetical protein